MTKQQAIPDSGSNTKALKIGLSLLFDPDLKVGAHLEYVNGVELAIDQDNQNGGLLIGKDRYIIQPVLYNSGLTGDTAKETINKLVYQDKVKFIISGGIDTEFFANIPETNKVLMLQHHHNFVPAPKYQYVFNGTGRAAQACAVPGWIFRNYPDAAKSYVMAFPEEVKWIAETEERIANKLGVSPTIALYPNDTKDFTAFVDHVLTLKPKLFASVGRTEAETGLLYGTMRRAGYKGLLFFPPTVSTQSLQKVFSPEALEGLIGSAEATEFSTSLVQVTQATKDFRAAWIAKYGEWTSPTTIYTGNYYCLRAALQQAGSVDVNNVVEVLNKGLKFDSPSGPTQMINRPDIGNNRTIDSVGTYFVKQIIGGQPKLLAAIGIDDALKDFRVVNPPLK